MTESSMQLSNQSYCLQTYKASAKLETTSIHSAGVQIFENVYFCACAILIFLSNILLIVAMVSSKYLRYPQGILLSSISVANFILGTETLFAFFSAVLNYDVLGKTACSLVGYLSQISQTVWMFTIAAMSLDQWLLFHRSLTYHMYVTPKTVVKINIGIWIISFLLYTPYFFDYFHFRYIMYTHLCVIDRLQLCSREGLVIIHSVIFLPCFLIIFICNIWSCRTAHIHMKQVHTQTHVHIAPSGEYPIKLRETRPIYKHFKTTLLILAGFITTSMPAFVIQLLYSTTRMQNINKTLLFYVEWSVRGGSFMNSFICICTHKALRKSLKKLLNRRFSNSNKLIKK